VHPGGNMYLKIVGSCSSCNSRFTREMENESGENTLIINSCKKYEGIYKSVKEKIK